MGSVGLARRLRVRSDATSNWRCANRMSRAGLWHVQPILRLLRRAHRDRFLPVALGEPPFRYHLITDCSISRIAVIHVHSI